MRDLFLLAFLPYLIYLILRRPFVGAALWIWSSLLMPANWMWGIAAGLRYNLIIVIAAVGSYLLQANKPRIAWTTTATFAVLFYLWFSLSAINAITETSVPWIWWDTFTRIFVLVIFCQLVLVKKLHWDVFIWAMVLALGGYGMLEATKYIASGFNHQIVGMGGQLRDRNDLALALNVMIPLAVYLKSQATHRYIRLGLRAMIVLLPVAIIGTFSRGGLVTLLFIGLFYLMVSGRRFIPLAITMGVLAFGLSYVVTDEYIKRAETIQTADEDASFMGRASAWKLSLYIALDRPLIGGGPFAVQTPDVSSRYRDRYDSEEWFSTGPFEQAARAAHSMYFQVLGDTGFVGFGWFMLMLSSAALLMLRTVRHARRIGDQGLESLATGLLLALGAYMVGGAALSVAYYDLLFGLIGLISAVGGRAMAVQVVSAVRLRASGRAAV